MNLNELAEFNRIIIIDDNQKEGESIREALSTERVPSLFIHYKNERVLPSEPFPNVRLVFLDLDMLPGVATRRPKARHALKVLSQIVGSHSFYVLIIWSMHVGDRLERDFKEIINDKQFTYMRPIVDPIPLIKPVEKKFPIDRIKESIAEYLAKIPNFGLLMQWEATVEKSKSRFINGIFANDNQYAISQKLHALAESYAGKEYENNVAQYALLALSEALRGSINTGVVSKDYSSYNLNIDSGISPLAELHVAKLNSELMLNPELTPGPGCVYLAEESIATKYFEKLLKEKNKEGCRCIKVDVTPLCDSAQKKNVFTYFIYGILVPRGQIKVKSEGYIFGLHNYYFLHEGKSVNLILNLMTLETIPKTDDGAMRGKKRGGNSCAGAATQCVTHINEPLFRLKDSIVVDIQHRIAGHNSRPGHILLSGKQGING